MDLKSMALFNMAASKMDWLAQRQSVLANNVANADTPRFRPSDVVPIEFKGHEHRRPKVRITRTNAKHMQYGSPRVEPTRTNDNHMPGTIPEQRPFRARAVTQAYETSIDENSVVLEEQMVKMSRTRHAYDTAATLYQKHMNLIETALSKGGP